MCNTKNTAMFNESKTTVGMYKSAFDADFKGPIPYQRAGSIHTLGKPVNE
jgi:hypothetical protein